MKYKKIQAKGLLLLMISSITLLGGCRTSPVLEQVVYQENEEPDQNNDTNAIDNEPEHTQQDEELAAQTEVEEASSQQDQSREDALQGETQQPVDQTYEEVANNNSDNNGNASTDETDASNTGNGDSDQGQQNGTGQNSDSGEKGDGSGDGGENENPSEDGQGDSSGGNGDADDGTDGGTTPVPGDGDEVKQVVDARGETIDLPENVDTVTAVGEAAVMVEMLGGNGRLLASSGSLTQNSNAQTIFASQGIGDVQTWWDGSGTGTIGAGAFESLLEQKPQVCFEISGQNTFSSDQIARMAENEITYVVLPSLTTVSNLKQAVSIVGEVLGDRSSDGGTDAPGIATQYCGWVDSILSVAGSGDAKYTLFVSAWDYDAQWQIYNSINGVYASGNGVAIGQKKARYSPLNEYMSDANLINLAQDNVYLNPLRNNYWLIDIGGGAGKFNYGQNLTVSGASSDGVALGTYGYPAIIASDASVKSEIENSMFWISYGITTLANGTSAYGFNDGENHIIGTSIQGPYEIYVNPTGVLGDWTEGTVESPLELMWLSCKFQGGCSIDDVKNKMNEFYNTFYHCNVDTFSILGE